MEQVNEVEALREIIGRQKQQIELLAAHFTRHDEAALNQLAASGASGYIQNRCKGMPLTEKQLVLNAVAHGIVMGYRRKEQDMGIPRPDQLQQKPLTIAGVDPALPGSDKTVETTFAPNGEIEGVKENG